MAIDFIYKFLYMEIYGLIHILAGKASQCRKIYNLLLKYFMPIFLLTVENDGKICYNYFICMTTLDFCPESRAVEYQFQV